MIIIFLIVYIVLCAIVCFYIHSLSKSMIKNYEHELNEYKSRMDEIKIGSVVRINNNDIIDSNVYVVKQIEKVDDNVYLILYDENSEKIIKTNLNNVVKLY